MIALLPDLEDAPSGVVVAGWFDPQTQLPGPDFWDAILATEAARWARYHRPTTIVRAEIVGLDELGGAWDRDVLRQCAVAVGRTLRSERRASDYLARLDGVGFAALLSETDEIAAINMVERVRLSCARTLRGVAGNPWVAFGWASPTAHRGLLGAAKKAESRLRTEADVGTPG